MAGGGNTHRATAKSMAKESGMEKDALIASLRVEVEALKERIEELQQENNSLKIRLLALGRFADGKKSEKVDGGRPAGGEAGLDEAKEAADEAMGCPSGKEGGGTTFEDRQHETLVNEAEGRKKRHSKAKGRGNNGVRRNDYDDLPTEYRYLDLVGLDEETMARLRKIGDEHVEVIEHQPSSVFKVVYMLPVYYDPETESYRRVPLPADAAGYVKWSNYSVGFLVHLAVMKYEYGMTMDRISEMIREDTGVTISTSTMSRLLQRGAELLKPLYNVIQACLLMQTYISCDETFYKLQTAVRSKKSGKCIRKSYIWMLTSKDRRLAYYWNDLGSRSKEVVIDLLGSYEGTIQSDGYPAYKNLLAALKLSCLQHVKRPLLNLAGNKEAEQLFNTMNKLYEKDHEHTVGEDGWTLEDHTKWRAEYAPPILDEVEAALDVVLANEKDYPKGSLMNRAASYAKKEWPAIRNIFTDGRYALDNNSVENLMRIVGRTRKNSLFFGSYDGLDSGCVWFTMIACCKLNEVCAYDYLCDIILKCRELAARHAPEEEYEKLLADQWEPVKRTLPGRVVTLTDEKKQEIIRKRDGRRHRKNEMRKKLGA